MTTVSDESRTSVDAGEPLQLDKVEVADGHDATSCAACKNPITDTYYEVNGSMACPACHAIVVQAEAAGSGSSRFMRALVWGGLGAIVGAAAWMAVTKITGWEIGLVAIVVGLLVGHGVKKGADARGGFVYQSLAVFLTYTAIVSTYVPDIVSAIREGAESERLARASLADPSSTSHDASSAEAQADSSGDTAAPLDATSSEDLATTPDLPAPLAFVMFAVLVGGIAFAAPFFDVAGNIIGIAIIGFALFEAWKINKRVRLDISGPFQLMQRPVGPPFGTMSANP